MKSKLNLKLSVLFLSILLIGFSKIQAAPLKDVPQELTQPDGSIIKCLASGDEFFNYLHDEAGNIIIQDPETGYYMYAVYQGEVLAASNIRVDAYTSELSLAQADGLKIANQDNFKIDSKTLHRIQEQQRMLSQADNTLGKGKMEGIVIFVKFKGESEFNISYDKFIAAFNSSEKVSLKNYFQEVSNNQLTIESYLYPKQDGQYFAYEDKYPRGYYEPYNKVTNPMGYKGGDDSSERYKREQELYRSTLEAIEAQIPKDLKLDSNGDGLIDSLTLIVKGSAGGWLSILWPHYMWSSDSFATINGIQVKRVIFQLEESLGYYDEYEGEYFSAVSNVGVLAHETFHIIGAPDLYHYSYDGKVPVGPWDLMEYTSSTPQHMLMYMKYQYGKWIKEIPEITASGTYSLNPSTSLDNNVYRIATEDPDQYYMLEYRENVGKYEGGVWNSGLLVYRVDTSVEEGNRNGPPDEVYVYRPTVYEYEQIDYATLNDYRYWQEISASQMVLQDGTPGHVSIRFNEMKDGKVYFEVLFDNAKTGWSLENGIWYYYNESGNKVINWQLINGEWYYFYSTGEMAACTEIDGWVIDGDGVARPKEVAHVGWLLENNIWYYYDAAGNKVTDWQLINGEWYYFYSSGEMATYTEIDGWVIDGNGVAKPKEVTHVGWLLENNIWYYYDAASNKVTDWQLIGGEWYYFYSTGEMATHTEIDGWYIGEDGRAYPILLSEEIIEQEEVLEEVIEQEEITEQNNTFEEVA